MADDKPIGDKAWESLKKLLSAEPATTSGSKEVTGATEPGKPGALTGFTGGMRRVASTLLSDDPEALAKAFKEGGTGFSALLQAIPRMEKFSGQIEKLNGLFGAGTDLVISYSDAWRTQNKQFIHAIAQSGILANNLLQVGGIQEKFSDLLGDTAKTTGQSFQEIASGSSKVFESSMHMAQGFKGVTDVVSQTENAFKTYAETVVVSRNVGMDHNEVIASATDLWEKQGQTLHQTNAMMLTLNKSVSGTGLTTKQAMTAVGRLAQSYEFLEFDSTKASLAIGKVAMFARDNQTAFKSPQQAVKTFTDALQGVAGVQQDLSKSTFFGTMMKTGGKIGLEAALEFEDLGPVEALKSVTDTIGGIFGGQGIVTKSQAKAEGGQSAAMFIAQRKMLQDQLGLGQAQAGRFMDLAKKVEMGVSLSEKEKEEVASLNDATKLAQEGDKAYQNRMYESSRQIQKQLGGIKATTRSGLDDVATAVYDVMGRSRGVGGIKDFLEDQAKTIRGIGKGALEGVADLAIGAESAILDSAKDIFSKGEKIWDAGSTYIGGVLDGLGDKLGKFGINIDTTSDKISNAWNWMTGDTPGPKKEGKAGESWLDKINPWSSKGDKATDAIEQGNAINKKALKEAIKGNELTLSKESSPQVQASKAMEDAANQQKQTTKQTQQALSKMESPLAAATEKTQVKDVGSKFKDALSAESYQVKDNAYTSKAAKVAAARAFIGGSRGPGVLATLSGTEIGSSMPNRGLPTSNLSRMPLTDILMSPKLMGNMTNSQSAIKIAPTSKMTSGQLPTTADMDAYLQSRNAQGILQGQQSYKANQAYAKNQSTQQPLPSEATIQINLTAQLDNEVIASKVINSKAGIKWQKDAGKVSAANDYANWATPTNINS